MLWVKTGYSSSASAASVRINSTQIDKIWPRPWVSHSFIDMEAISIPFSPNLFNTIPGNPWIPLVNVLTIVPQGGSLDYVLVEHVFLLSRS